MLAFCDFHGHSRKMDVFAYGCESPDSVGAACYCMLHTAEFLCNLTIDSSITLQCTCGRTECTIVPRRMQYCAKLNSLLSHVECTIERCQMQPPVIVMAEQERPPIMVMADDDRWKKEVCGLCAMGCVSWPALCAVGRTVLHVPP